jgi:hypothetical protein
VPYDTNKILSPFRAHLILYTWALLYPRLDHRARHITEQKYMYTRI